MRSDSVNLNDSKWSVSIIIIVLIERDETYLLECRKTRMRKKLRERSLAGCSFLFR